MSAKSKRFDKAYTYPGGIKGYISKIKDYFSSRDAAETVMPCGAKLGDASCEALAMEQAALADAQAKAALASAVYDKPDSSESEREIGKADGRLPHGYRAATQDELNDIGLYFPESNTDLTVLKDGHFKCEVYVEESTGKYIVAFKGSQINASDWGTNIKQAVGMQTEYYDRAMLIGAMVNSQAPGQVEFVGHSLGGGLATAATIAAGNPPATATTFNAAGLNSATLKRDNLPMPKNAPAVKAYYVRGELLSSIQDSTPAPGAVGDRKSLPADPSWKTIRDEVLGGVLGTIGGLGGAVAGILGARAVHLHLMNEVNNSLAKQRKSLLALQRLKGCPQ